MADTEAESNNNPGGSNSPTSTSAWKKMEDKKDFNAFVSEYVKSKKFRRRYEFPDKKLYDTMLKVLKLRHREAVEGVTAADKSRLQRRFTIVKQQGKEYIAAKKNGKRILHQQLFFQVIRKAHEQAGHPGRDATSRKLHDSWFYVPYHLVSYYVRLCPGCSQKRPVPKPLAGTWIKAQGPMERVQVDILDMSAMSDGTHHWIIHARDHFTKFNWARPLAEKSCQVVSAFLKSVFFTFGPPKVLQCENREEFQGPEVKTMLDEFFPNTKITYYTNRDRRSVDLMEGAKGNLESRICGYVQEFGPCWSSAVDMLVHEVNTTYSRVIKCTPYEMMFSRKVNSIPPTDDDLKPIEFNETGESSKTGKNCDEIKRSESENEEMEDEVEPDEEEDDPHDPDFAMSENEEAEELEEVEMKPSISPTIEIFNYF